MDEFTSKEHLLIIDFSSYGFQTSLTYREVEGRGRKRPRCLTFSSFLFDDAEGPIIDLAPGRKVHPFVDLSDVQSSLGAKKEYVWKWFVPTVSGKSHLTPLESAPRIYG
jgi:hypothetical protein